MHVTGRPRPRLLSLPVARMSPVIPDHFSLFQNGESCGYLLPSRCPIPSRWESRRAPLGRHENRLCRPALRAVVARFLPACTDRARRFRVVRSRVQLWACAALVFSALSFAGESGVSISRAREIVDDLGRSIVNVQLISQERGRPVAMASFSGIVVRGERELILACHPRLKWLLEKTKGRLKVTYDDMWQGDGSLQASDETTGLCLIRCTGNPNTPPGISLEPAAHLSRGTSVLTIANPYGIQHSARFGVANGPSCGGATCSCLVVRLRLDAVRGREGGVACDLNGALAGIILPIESSPAGDSVFNAVRTLAPRMTLPQTKVLPTRAAGVIVKHLKEKRRVLRGWIGAGFTVCGTGKRCFVRVSKVEPDGPADRAGLKDRDVVLQANGTNVASLRDLYELAFWVEYEGLGKDLVLLVRHGEGPAARLVIPVAVRSQR